MRWAYVGTQGRNESFDLVYDYFIRKSLASLGFSLDIKELSDFEAQYLTLIANEFKIVEAEQAKRRARR